MKIFFRRNLILISSIVLLLSLNACLRQTVQDHQTDSPPVLAHTLIPATEVQQTRTPLPDRPAPEADTQVTLDPVTEDDYFIGDANSRNTLLIYVDYQSPASAYLMNMIPEILERHPDDLKIVLRNFPLLTVNDKSLEAAQAAEAAGRQDAFWPFAEMLFEQQEAWRLLETAEFESWLQNAAVNLGLDMERFERDLQSAELTSTLVEDFYKHAAAGLLQVPTIFLNQKEFMLPLTAENLEASIRIEMLQHKQFSAYPPLIVSSDSEYTAIIQTNFGTMEIILYPLYAPLAVNSFIQLAESGWYDGTPIYRVHQGSFIEAGDPSGTGWGDPGYVFPTETDPLLDFSKAWMVAMVAHAPDANGSNFFITLEPLPQLNGHRTIFGRLLTGGDFLLSLGDRDPIENILLEPEAVIESIRIVSKP